MGPATSRGMSRVTRAITRRLTSPLTLPIVKKFPITVTILVGRKWRRNGRPLGGLENPRQTWKQETVSTATQHRSLDPCRSKLPTHRSKQGTFGFCWSCRMLPGKRCGRGSLGHLSLRPLRQRSNPHHAVIEGPGNGWPWRLHHPWCQVLSNRLPGLNQAAKPELGLVRGSRRRRHGVLPSADEAVG